MREYRSVLVVAAVALAFLAWWTWFLRTGGDVQALANRAGIAIFGDSLERQTRAIAGWGCKNCGRAPASGGHAEVTECALSAYRAGQPFRVRYDIQGRDSVVSMSFIRDKRGTLHWLYMDDESDGTKFSQQVRERGCLPILTTTQSGRLTCDPESSK